MFTEHVQVKPSSLMLPLISAAAKLDKRKVTLDAPGRLAASIAQTPIKAVPNKQRFAFG